jgi:hypothetical protein
MTIWFLVVVSCLSPGNLTTCHNDGHPIMTFESRDQCRAVVMESLRLAVQARKSVSYACERGFAT